MIQTGMIDYGPQTQGWNLGSGTGVRQFVSPDIAFQPPFVTPPRIALAISGLDSEHSTNLRVTVESSDIEADEFNIVIRTWDDSLVYSVVVTWIAYD